MEKINKYCLPGMIKGLAIFYGVLIFAGIIWIFTNATYDKNGISDLCIRLVFAFVFMLSDILFYHLSYGKSAKIYDKRVKYFRDQGVLDLLKSDFSNGVQLFGGDLTVGKMFLFGKNTGMIVMFQEITRFFIHVHTTEYESGRTPTKKFELKFVAGNKHYVLCKIPNKNMNTSEWNQFCNFISLKNPNIILDQHMEMTRSCVDDTVSNDD